MFIYEWLHFELTDLVLWAKTLNGQFIGNGAEKILVRGNFQRHCWAKGNQNKISVCNNKWKRPWEIGGRVADGTTSMKRI